MITTESGNTGRPFRSKKGRQILGSLRSSFDPVCLFSGLILFFIVPTFLFFSVENQKGIDLSLARISVGALLRNKIVKQATRQRPSNPYELKYGANHTVTIDEVVDVLSAFLTGLRDKWSQRQENSYTYHDVWYDYHAVAVEHLIPFDAYYLAHMPTRRDDDSIFVSMASYRDEYCMETLEGAYSNSENPAQLNIGIVQQNCNKDCMSGVLENGRTEPVPADPDCYTLFCATALGQPHCDEGRVRVLRVEESESMGPFAARYFASKLWGGESWMLQIDSHMTFAEHWDTQSITMLKNAPSTKPIISHYPPQVGFDFIKGSREATTRVCGPTFSGSQVETQIIRFEVEAEDRIFNVTPRFAPFVAAGYFVAHSGILQEVPFDPMMPWVFMGEEIIMSSRAWTHGYDIFSPTHAVVAHRYVRNHKPKYWETVGRRFWDGIDTPLGDLVVNRVKYQLGYPESARDMIQTKSVLTAVEKYSMGKVRPLKDYIKIIGLDVVRKEVTITHWCETGQPPEYAKNLTYLYN